MQALLSAAVLLGVAWGAAVPQSDLPGPDTSLAAIIRGAEANQAVPLAVAEDAKLLVPEVIRKYGYPCEEHTVISGDGYVLKMHRIPHGKDGASPNRPAVYLQHGILASSADWILAGPDKALAYILADEGYDVWMSNARGSRYSRKHVVLDPDLDAKDFWDFSWHEIAVDDVPAMVDYVIEKTRQEKIFYIGHSQGTTVFYVMCSEKPQYNNKFRAMFSLAPIGYMKHMTSPLMRLIAIADGGLNIIFKMIGMYEFLPNSEFLGSLGEIFCRDGSIFQLLCTNALFAVCGFNPSQMNATLLPVVMGHTPAGSSTKQFLHYAQEINSGKFRKYDYGMLTNLKLYGSLSPPNYKLKNVVAPVYLHYSRNDWLSNEKDVITLYKELGNVQGKFVSQDNKFNHVDYLYGIDVKELLYKRVLGLMKRH